MKKVLLGFALMTMLLTPLSAFAASFKDVQTNHWASKPIEWGTSTGVVTGYPDNTFRPENSVTEEEFLTMLISAYKKRSDLQGAATHWSDPFYYFAYDQNYPTKGWDEPTARQWKINRERVAEIVAGATGANYSGDNAIKWLLGKGLAKGKSADVSVDGYKGSDLLTRAEAVQFIKNAKENGLTELKVRPTQPSDPSAIPPLPGQSQQPTTPGQPQNPSAPGTVTVVPSSNPEFLLPKDPITELSVQAFLDSLRYANGVVTGTIPDLPSGHVMTLTYTDEIDKKKNKDFSTLKSGQSFSITVIAKGGQLNFAIYKGNIGKNEAYVKVPSLQAEWGSKH